MDEIKALNYLSEQKRTNTEFAGEWTEIESLFIDKSWDELTTKILLLISHPALRNESSLVQLYRNFISSFETKIDPYKLVDIISVVTNFMGDKTDAVRILENIEETVKNCDDALWHCSVLKGQIHLNHLDDLEATKKIINNFNLVILEATDAPAYWKRFLLEINYYQRVLDQQNDNYGQLERKFDREIERLNRENEKLRENFDNSIAAIKTEIEAKFATEAVHNFEEVINSQTEVANLRKLNGRLLIECSQLRNPKFSLEGDKTKLEAKLEAVIAEQEQQKSALMLMGALLEKLTLKSDGDASRPSNESCK